jgi:hypothetical protein
MPKVAEPEFSRGATSTFEVREDQPRSDEGADEMVMTTHLKRLFDACEAIDQNQITPEEFVQVLDWAEDLLDQGESQVANISRPGVPMDLDEEEEESVQEQLDLVDETADLLAQGITEFRNGLDMMRSYAESRNRDSLVRGIRTVWEASQKIYQVQRMGAAVEKLALEREQAALAAHQEEEPEEESED